ncbi:MAG TPA: ABC transporter permease [Rhodoferax sp.]|nr:ABC transporter permease [Giesbergeria sp.]HPW84756.1 ABC transporter permease [Rhodoferax sp.]HQC86136.1 ABC transporter permease [Rhodoferax sp.]HQY77022.1 ABC transporter permease [Rhodoferax sp.]
MPLAPVDSAQGAINVVAFSARREVALLRSRPWDLAMITWVPALACLLLWWIFSAGLPTRLPIGLVDDDHSALSRQLTRFLDATPGLAVAVRYANAAEAERGLRSAEVYAVVRIPGDFTRTVKQGRAAQVTLLHNAQLGTHSGLIQRDVRTVVGTLSAGIEMAARNKRGEPAQTVRVSMEPVRTGMVTLFNASLDYEQFLAAALLPALLHILAMTAGAWSVGRELRDRTVAQWLGAHPTFRQVLGAVAGKLWWSWLGLGLVGTAALVGITWGRGWHPAGSVAWTCLALWVFLALSIAMGALAASATRSLRTALSATGFITAPAFAFGGVGFPILAMPWGAQLWARALPFTHYIRVQMEQLQMGAPLAVSLATPLWMLLASALLLLASTLGLRAAADRPATWGKR